MAATIKVLKRVFKFKDRELPDPNPELSASEVLDFYSSKYPELTTGYISSVEEEENTLVHRVAFSVGEKA